MHRIDSVDATPDNKFTEGNPSVPIPATTVSAAWLNAVQEELALVAETAGLALDKSDNAQLLEAVRRIAAVSLWDAERNYLPGALVLAGDGALYAALAASGPDAAAGDGVGPKNPAEPGHAAYWNAVVRPASESVAGTARFATMEECRAGTALNAAVNPAGAHAVSRLSLSDGDLHVHVSPSGGGDGSSASSPATVAQALRWANGYRLAQGCVVLHFASGSYAPFEITRDMCAHPLVLLGTGDDTTITADNDSWLPSSLILRGVRCLGLAGFQFHASLQAVDGAYVRTGRPYPEETAPSLGLKFVCTAPWSGCLTSSLFSTLHVRDLAFLDMRNEDGRYFFGVVYHSAIKLEKGLNIALQGSVMKGSTAHATGNSYLYLVAGPITGTVTGPRYSSTLNSLIYVDKAGPNYLPGSVAGVADAASGALYY